jgi:hypothetical protein
MGGKLSIEGKILAQKPGEEAKSKEISFHGPTLVAGVNRPSGLFRQTALQALSARR